MNALKSAAGYLTGQLRQIGLFIALIGFVDAGFVRRMPDAAKTTVPVQLGSGGSLQGWPVVVFVIGLALVIALWVLKVRGAILISILATTVIAIVVEAIGDLGQGSAKNPTGWALTVPSLPGSPFDKPDFGTLGEFNLLGSFESVGLVVPPPVDPATFARFIQAETAKWGPLIKAKSITLE